MPTFPESAAVGGFIRGVEVSGQVESHEECDPYGDVGVAGEVGIYL